MVLALMCSTSFANVYTDQIVLTAPKQIYTTFDVKVFAILRNLYDNQTLVDVEDVAWQKAFLKQETQGFLEHMVLTRYLAQAKKSKSKVDPSSVDKARQKIQSVFQSDANQERVFKDWSIKESDVLKWLSARLKLEVFLKTYPPFQAIVTDHVLKTYYQERKADLFLNQDFKSIKPVVEQMYRKQHLQSAFGKWVTSEMRRQRWKVHQ